MGAVLTPVFDGLRKARDLPHACTMNGRCQEVCPVDIPLPTLLRGWRDRSWREGLEPATVRAAASALWAFVARRPAALPAGQRASACARCGCSGGGGWIRSLPLAGGWTAQRDFPAPPGKTFMELYRARGEGAPERARDGSAREDPRRGPRRARRRAGRRRRRSRPRRRRCWRDPELIRPRLPGTDLVELFAERVASPKVGTTLERVASLAELPAAVRRYLAAHGLPPAVALQPAAELQALDWGGIETAPTHGAGRGRGRRPRPLGHRRDRLAGLPLRPRHADPVRLPAAAPHRGAAGRHDPALSGGLRRGRGASRRRRATST